MVTNLPQNVIKNELNFGIVKLSQPTFQTVRQLSKQ